MFKRSIFISKSLNKRKQLIKKNIQQLSNDKFRIKYVNITKI